MRSVVRVFTQPILDSCGHNRVSGDYPTLMAYEVALPWKEKKKSVIGSNTITMIVKLSFFKIVEFMLQHLQMEETEVPRMCLELYKEYGTTMAGLKVKIWLKFSVNLKLFCSLLINEFTNYSLSFQALGYEFDNDEFHAYVHGRLPYEVLKPDPVLRNLLLSMPQRKIVCQKRFYNSFT